MKKSNLAAILNALCFFFYNNYYGDRSGYGIDIINTIKDLMQVLEPYEQNYLIRIYRLESYIDTKEIK